MDIQRWMTDLTAKLRDTFDRRLLFVGLQGSYRRGEAHGGSDIDAVVILDTLALEDLAAYRELLCAMPEQEKSCGFISGKEELLHWPRHELFQFARDTVSFWGTLDDLLPAITREDIADSVKISASGVYHACCHAFVHSQARREDLQALYKSAFFLLLAVHYLDTGVYAEGKRALLALLCGDERQILEISLNPEILPQASTAALELHYRLLLDWSGRLLSREF